MGFPLRLVFLLLGFSSFYLFSMCFLRHFCWGSSLICPGSSLFSGVDTPFSGHCSSLWSCHRLPLLHSFTFDYSMGFFSLPGFYFFLRFSPIFLFGICILYTGFLWF